MISKLDYEMAVLKIKGEIAKIDMLIEEQDLFVIENLLDASKDAEVTLACKTIGKYEELKKEYKESLYELHYLYNSQFAKPVPTSILGGRK